MDVGISICMGATPPFGPICCDLGWKMVMQSQSSVGKLRAYSELQIVAIQSYAWALYNFAIRNERTVAPFQ